MKYKDIKQFDGSFGLMIFGKTAELKQIHGRIKCIDDEKEIVTFKSTMRRVFNVKIKDIVSFEGKEPLPEITEVRGRKLLWDAGILIYEDNKKEFDAKR